MWSNGHTFHANGDTHKGSKHPAAMLVRDAEGEESRVLSLLEAPTETKEDPLLPIRIFLNTPAEEQDHNAFATYVTNPATIYGFAQSIKVGSIPLTRTTLSELLVVRDYLNLRSSDLNYSLEHRNADKAKVMAYNDLAAACAIKMFPAATLSYILIFLRVSFYNKHCDVKQSELRSQRKGVLVNLKGGAQYIWLRDISQTLMHKDYDVRTAKINTLSKLLTYPNMQREDMLGLLQNFYLDCAESSNLELEHLHTLFNMISALDAFLLRLENPSSEWGKRYNAPIIKDLALFRDRLQWLANSLDVYFKFLNKTERAATHYFHHVFQDQEPVAQALKNQPSMTG